MKKKLAIMGSLAILGMAMPTTGNGAEGATIRFHIVTAPSSASNSVCLQNVMSFVDKCGVIGLIPTNVLENSAALNMPGILRASEIIYSSSMHIWDGVANPAGVMSNEFGGRLAWTIDYTNTTSVLASSVSFDIGSSDAANTFRFGGNIAFNGSVPLTFSPLFRGEVWENGNVIASYHNGETVADHPVNRIITMIRIGWVVSTAAEVDLDLNYFRGQMPFTVTATFSRSNGWSVAKSINSRPFLRAYHRNSSGDELVVLQGQRRMGSTYGLLRTQAFEDPPLVTDWKQIMAGLVDGSAVTNKLPAVFYRAYEEVGNNRGVTMAPVSPPKAVIWLGPE